LITNAVAIPNNSIDQAFHIGAYETVSDAWKHGLNKDYWTHGITLNLGNDLSVSERNARRRLNYIRIHLLKEMFGNNFRRKGAKIRFLVFKQGDYKTFNQHFHVLMAIEGNHNWSAQSIAAWIMTIDAQRTEKSWDKIVHVDWDWKKGNRFHSYVSREATSNPDTLWVM